MYSNIKVRLGNITNILNKIFAAIGAALVASASSKIKIEKISRKSKVGVVANVTF